MRVLDGITVSNGIRVSNGIIVNNGIINELGGGVYAIPESGIGLTSAEWNGVYTSYLLSTSYIRIPKTSVTKVTLPVGIIDNNDSSFTNVTGVPITISGRIILNGYQSSSFVTFFLAAATDISGVDAPIINGVAMTRPFTGQFLAPLAWIVDYSVVLLAGSTVFPFMRSSAGGTINIATMTHSIWSKP